MLILIELLDIIGMKGVVYMEIEKKYLVSYIPDSLQKYRKKEIKYENMDENNGTVWRFVLFTVLQSTY